MRGREAELLSHGAKLVFVGSGLPAMAEAFAREHAGGHPVLSDAARRSFAAAGMRRSPWAILHWRFVRNAIRSLRGGFRQSTIQGDPWQQGGVLVFAADGALLHRQIDRAAGDELDLDVVCAVLAAGAAMLGVGTGSVGTS